MSSSESDDDCYGNIAQQVQKMKNNYIADKIATSRILDDSGELEDNGVKTTVTTNNEPENPEIDLGDVAGPSVSNDSDLSQEIIEEKEKTTKRMTRSRARKTNSEPDAPLDLPPSRSNKRKRGSTSTGASPRRRGRGSQRGWFQCSPGRGRGRNRRNNLFAELLSTMLAPVYAPVYAIGDAEEVDDLSRGQALFSNKPNDEVVEVEENDPLDDNEELSVKVYWQSCDVFKFKIRRYQKIAQIFDYFAENKNVSYDKLLFTYNEKILKPDDTPDSIDYSIVKFIDGGIVNQSVSQLVTKEKSIKNGIKIKFQCQVVKKPFEITIKPDDKFSLAMTKCAEHLEIPLSKLKFEFDGDSISGKSTAREMELEGGECIDVKIIS